jgi:multidrug efflux system outer membrane protein
MRDFLPAWSRGALLVGVICTVASGCAGLPPREPPPTLSHQAPLDLPGVATPGVTTPGVATPGPAAKGGWPDPEWWQIYQDPTLDRLISLALAASPTLAAAHLRFDSARESVRIAGAATGAQVGFTGDAERQRLSDNGIASLFPPQLLAFHWYNEFNLGLQASYTFDWWGRQRATVEAAMDQAHAAQAERGAAALALASSIADTYFGWQADQGRLALVRERLATALRETSIAKERVQAELDPGDSGERSDLALAGVREQIAALEGSAALRVVALAGLVGISPAELPPLAARPLPAVQASIPDDVRIDLIARRADITASRWRVEAAEKNLASARADFFPDVSINALAGLNSLTGTSLLEYASRAPNAALAVHLPLFDAGRLKARYRGVQVQIDAAVAAYDQTLVDAARDVATQVALRAQITAERAERAAQVDAAARLRAAAAARLRQGVSDSRAELAATESWLEQRDSLLQLDAAALSADISLQRALGGGYEQPAALARTNP